MLIAIMIILFIVGMTLLMIAAEECSDSVGWVGVIMMVISLVMLIFRMFSWICKSSKDRGNTSRCYNCC